MWPDRRFPALKRDRVVIDVNQCKFWKNLSRFGRKWSVKETIVQLQAAIRH